MAVRCPVCGTEFETDEEFAQHEHELIDSLRDSGAGFQCPTCGAMFDQEEGLVAHQAEGHPAAGG